MRRPFAAMIVLLIGASARADDLAKYDAKITDEDRGHWAFQAVKRPEVPSVKNADWCRNPVDRFVLAKLEAKGWTPAAPPSPSALLRRVYFDLIGLPPSLEEQERFVRDPSPEALDRVIDDLLARPAHGERWARHWLDLVRYGESNGFEIDAAKPFAWRYRDWVIRSLNDDKPYDRFLVEQLAGDELPDADPDTAIATGFNRIGPWDPEPADPKQDRFDQLDDLVATTSEVFMGLTLACARCHDHKFEPLTMHDYTRMVAIFDPLTRPRDERTERVLPAGSRERIRAEAERDEQIGRLRQDVERRREDARRDFLGSEACPLPPEVRQAFRAAPGSRTEAQKGLVAKNAEAVDKASLAAAPEEVRQDIARSEAAIARIRERTPDLPRGYFLWESSPKVAETHILARGQAASPGPAVKPGVPAVLAASQPEFLPPDRSTTRRRLSLARWLARPEHPLTARVIVNRVWQYHFGEGLVRTPNDFGTGGDPPTHPELLDWLADWFVNDAHWSLKMLHKLLLSSHTARMGKLRRDDYAAKDPENRLLWRMPYHRLEVEAMRDAMLSASGRLNPKMFGPSMYPPVPKGAVEGSSDPGKVWQASDEAEASRRTIYAFVKRSMIVPMMEVLDFCDTTRSAPRRVVTSSAPQALALFNGDFVNRQSAHFADRLIRETGDDPAKQIDRAFRLALGRPATPEEVATLTAYLDRESKPGGDPASRRRALERMARLIFNLNEFAYTD